MGRFDLSSSFSVNGSLIINLQRIEIQVSCNKENSRFIEMEIIREMSVANVIVRMRIHREFKFDAAASETTRKTCTAFRTDYVSERTAQKWFKKFGTADERVEDELRYH